MKAADLAELLELGAAGEPVGQHHRIVRRPGARRAAGRSRPPPGRRRNGRVPCRSSRPARSSRRPRRRGRRSGPAARSRRASPSRRAGGSAAGPRARTPPRSGGSHPGVAVSSSANVRVAACTWRARGSSGSSSVRSPRSTAVHEGSSPTIGMPVFSAPSRARRLRRSWRRAPSSWPVEIQVSPQHTGWPVIPTAYPAASSTRTAAWPTSGVKWSVNVSTHSRTGDPARGGRRANQSRKVRAAKRGSGRRASTPASHLAGPARASWLSAAFASPGAREASAAQRGSQPSA